MPCWLLAESVRSSSHSRLIGGITVLSYLPEEQADADHVIQQIEATGRRAIAVPGDITTSAACAALVETAVDALGGLDAVVNVAGKQVWKTRIEDIDDEQWELTYRTNVFAPFWIARAAVPHLQPGSTIVNTASLEAYTPRRIGLITRQPRGRSTISRRGGRSNLSSEAFGSMLSRPARHGLSSR